MHGHREIYQNEDGKLSFEEFRDQTPAMLFYASEFETSVENANPKMTMVEQKFAELHGASSWGLFGCRN